MTSALSLPRQLDFSAARELWSSLDERRGAAVVLAANEVERLSASCLQVLLAAAEEWRRTGCAFRVHAASEAFTEALKIMGASALLSDPA